MVMTQRLQHLPPRMLKVSLPLIACSALVNTLY